MATEGMQVSERIEKNMRAVSLVCAYVLICFANYMMKANFNLVGPLLVMVFYWYIRASRAAALRNDGWSWGKRFSILLFAFALYLALYFWVRSGFGDAARWCREVTNYAPWVLGHVIAAFIISLYNGKLGLHEKWFSRLYLRFYPAHAFIIGVICVMNGR